MHELCVASALRDELEEIEPHRVDAAQGAKQQKRRGRRALTSPCAALDERGDLSLRRPPEVSAKWKVDVDDRVGSGHAPIDHRPRSEAVDDPRFLRSPGLERVCDLVERCTPPPGKPLDLVNLMHRNLQVASKDAREGGLAPASVADDRDPPRETIVTRKRERGPPPSRERRTSADEGEDSARGATCRASRAPNASPAWRCGTSARASRGSRSAGRAG